jgi:hypothetical protein
MVDLITLFWADLVEMINSSTNPPLHVSLMIMGCQCGAVVRIDSRLNPFLM